VVVLEVFFETVVGFEILSSGRTNMARKGSQRWDRK
jgi:hypothetical protein